MAGRTYRNTLATDRTRYDRWKIANLPAPIAFVGSARSTHPAWPIRVLIRRVRTPDVRVSPLPCTLTGNVPTERIKALDRGPYRAPGRKGLGRCSALARLLFRMHTELTGPRGPHSDFQLQVPLSTIFERKGAFCFFPQDLPGTFATRPDSSDTQPYTGCDLTKIVRSV
jgi:hypothetical protein